MSQQKLMTMEAQATVSAGRRVAHGRKWAVQGALYLTLVVFLVLTFVPLAIMVTMSFRNNGQIYANFWGLPDPWLFSNYVQGFTSVIHYAVNSIADSLASVALIVVLSSPKSCSRPGASTGPASFNCGTRWPCLCRGPS